MKSLKLSLNKGITILLVLIAQVCFSQDLCFFAKDTVGCAPFEIEIEDCGDTTKPTFYSYDNGQNATQSMDFKFTVKGEYDIWQFIGRGDIDTLTKKQYITVLDDPKPIFTLSACADFVVLITFQNNDYDRYIITYSHTFDNDTILRNTEIKKRFGDNTPVEITVKGIYNQAECFNSSSNNITPIKDIILPTIDSLINSTANSTDIYFTQHPYHFYEVFTSTDNTVFSIENQANENTFFFEWNNSTSKSVYLKTSDACGNTKLSDTLPTISLNGVAQNTVNKLNWITLSSKSQEIFRNETTINSSTENYNDTDINCGETYDYFVQEKQDNSTIKSNSVNLKAISTNTPAPLKDFYTSVVNNKITFYWTSNSVKTLNIYDKSLTLLASLEADGNNTIQSDFNPITNTCFYASYIDLCDNKSDDNDTVKSFNSVLNHQATSTNEFYWNTFNGSTNVSSYTIEWYDDQFNIIESTDVNNSLYFSSDLIFDAAQFYNVRIKITLDNDSIAYTNYIHIEQNAIIKFPTAFSPNNDGLNDLFKPLTLFVKDYSMTILSLRNEILYQGKEWDGQTEVYEFIYIFDYTDQNNKAHELTGSGLIIK